MSWSLDARIPLRLVRPADLLAAMPASGAALLLEAPLAVPPGAGISASFDGRGAAHLAGCACCTGRSAAAQALDRLFQARVRNAGAWFDCVLAVTTTDSGRAQLHLALAEDSLTRARFRPA